MDNIFHKIGSFISRQDYFLKWFILGLINGVVSGLGALFFYYSLKLCEFIFFNKILHYHIPSPTGEEPNYLWRLFYIQIPSKNKRRFSRLQKPSLKL